jgi:hypothetical protein
MTPSARFRIALCATLACLTVAGPALGNGRAPATSDIRVHSGTGELLAGTTFGLTVSTDDGASWGWVCESAIGYGGTFDPDYEWSPSGAVFVTSFQGLRVAKDRCSFEATGLADRYIAAITFGSDGALYAAANDDQGSRIYRSADQGVSFPQVSAISPLFKNYDAWQSLEVAPSAPTQVYLAGIRAAANQPRQFLFYHSIDSALTFVAKPLTGVTTAANSTIEIAGVSYTDPKVVYLRVLAENGSTGDAIYRSSNSGDTWTKVLAKADSLKAFVVRRSGEVIAATPTLGAFRSSDGLTFTPIAAAPRLSCLTERADGMLFGCTQNYGTPGDDAGIMKSADATTWSKVLRYQDIQSPVACAPGSEQKVTCEALEWCGIKEQLGITSTAVECLAAPDGGPPMAEPSSGGCCDAGQSTSSLLLTGLALALVALRRRRGRAR